MYCIIKSIAQGKQARVKNANLRHPSSMCKWPNLNTGATSPKTLPIMPIIGH